jgi:hypothetical protein
MTVDTAFVEQLRHKCEIHDALLRYCRGIDRFDLGLVRSAYHDDGFDDHGTYKGDIPGLLEWVERRHVHVEQSMHAIHNCLIELNGDVAVAETYCVAYQRYDAEALETREMYLSGPEALEPRPIQVLVNVRYVDRFELRDAWRIARRTVVMEAVRAEPVTIEMPVTSWAMQQRTSADPLWRVRAEAGLS